MRHVPVSVLALVALGATALTGQVIYNNSSTAGEGYQRGAASIISAQGERNVNNSQANINNQDAYSKAIDNSTKSVNAFWEQKSIYDQHLQEKLNTITAKRNFYLENHGLGTLSSEEFDRTSGAINWPKVLEQPVYSQYRSTIDKCFKQRAYAGALSGEEYVEAANASKDWRAKITSQKGEYPTPIMTQMLKFILKVDRELDDNLG
jgi:hypothetical protein